MLTLKVDQDHTDTTNVAYSLHEIAQLVEQGYTSGEGWSLSGEPESDEEN